MSDCTHDWTETGGHLGLVVVADDWQGVTTGLILCSGCGNHALIQLLAWQGKQLADRVYRVATIPSEAASVFLRNIKSNYCDLARHGQEFDALLACASPSHLVATRLPYLTVAAARAIDDYAGPSPTDWRELKQKTADPVLQTLLNAIAPSDGAATDKTNQRS